MNKTLLGLVLLIVFISNASAETEDWKNIYQVSFAQELKETQDILDIAPGDWQYAYPIVIGEVVKDTIAKKGDTDYFKFYLDNLSSVYIDVIAPKTMNTGGANPGVVVEIKGAWYPYGITGKKIEIGKTGTVGAVILNPGLYYVYVYEQDGAGNNNGESIDPYSFKVNAVKAATGNDQAPNDWYPATLIPGNTISDTIAKTGDRDIWRFDVTKSGDVVINITAPKNLPSTATGSGIVVEILGKDYPSSIASKRVDAGSSGVLKTTFLNPGTYWLRIYQQDDAGKDRGESLDPYTLVLSGNATIEPDAVPNIPGDPDLAPDSWYTANTIYLNKPVSDEINAVGDRDTYRIYIDTLGEVNINITAPKQIITNGVDAGIWVGIYGANYPYGITSKKIDVNTSGTLSVILNPGYYWIYVHEQDSLGNDKGLSTDPYTIVMSEFITTGDDKASADWRYAYPMTTGQVVKETIAKTGDRDYFMFDLDNLSSVYINVTAPETMNTGGANPGIVVEIKGAWYPYGITGKKIEIGKTGTVSAILNPGRYYVYVYEQDASGNDKGESISPYSLEVGTLTYTGNDIASADWQYAYHVLIGQEVKDTIAKTGDRDYFNFDIDTLSNVSIDVAAPKTMNTEGVDPGIVVELKGAWYPYAITGKKIEVNKTGTVSAILDPGRYYVYVYEQDASGNDKGESIDPYSFKVNAVKAATGNDQAPNDWYPATLIPGNTISDTIAKTGDRDIWRFDVTKGGDVVINITAPETMISGAANSSIVVEILGKDYPSSITSKRVNAGSSGVLKAAFLNPGTYWLRIYQQDDVGKDRGESLDPYTLVLSGSAAIEPDAVPTIPGDPDLAPDSWYTANTIYLNKPVSNEINTVGDRDTYRVFIDTLGEVNINISAPKQIIGGANAGIVVGIYGANYPYGITSKKVYANTSATLSVILNPGYYWIYVYEHDDSGYDKGLSPDPYTIVMSEIITTGDDKASADWRYTYPIAMGQEVKETIAKTGDRDYFKFYLDHQDEVSIGVDAPDAIITNGLNPGIVVELKGTWYPYGITGERIDAGSTGIVGPVILDPGLYYVYVYQVDDVGTDRGESIDPYTIFIGAQPLSAAITSPKDGQTFMQGEVIDFKSIAAGGTPPYGYEWSSSIDGMLSTLMSFSTALSEGVHNITLKVTDKEGAVASDSINITVKRVEGLIVSVSPQKKNVSKGETFSVNITIDPNNIPVYSAQFSLYFNNTILQAVKIDQGSFLSQDGASTLMLVSTVNNTIGSIEYGETRTGVQTGITNKGTLAKVTFLVKDTASPGDKSKLDLENLIISDPAPKPILNMTVIDGLVEIPSNQPPVAVVELNHTSNNVGSPVYFNGTKSFDIDGSIIAYDWNFGDGATGAGEVAKHVYATKNYPGYDASLKVTDNMGKANATTFKLHVWIAGDANGDKTVNILDAAKVGLAWNSKYGDGYYNDGADLNNDDNVNILDAALIGLNWGKTDP